MDLSTLGALVCVIYILGIFAFQWVTDWYFNVINSPLLDHLYATWMYYTHKESDNG
jgi:hypothetical protein